MLFRQSFGRFWTIANGILFNRSQIEDVIQEAAIVAWQKREQFQKGTSFAAWMGQIVRFTALNHARKERKSPTAVESIDELHRPDQEAPASVPLRLTPTFELPADQTAFGDSMMEALAEINIEPRTCFLLRVVENMEYRDIARIMDMPEGTAMSHVHRTKGLLRTRLSIHAPLTQADTENEKTG